MNRFRPLLCSLVSLALAAAPFGPAHAQSSSQTYSHTACINYNSLPAGETVSFQFPGDTQWRGSTGDSRYLFLAANSPLDVKLLVWKQIPRHAGERTGENTRMYALRLSAAPQPANCSTTAAAYHLRSGDDGYQLYSGFGWEWMPSGGATGSSGSTSGSWQGASRNDLSGSGSSSSSSSDTTRRSSGPSGSDVVMGLAGLLLLGALLGAISSSGSTGSSARGTDRADELAAQRRWDQERARRDAADRAAQDRRDAAAYERLQRPNSLGW